MSPPAIMQSSQSFPSCDYDYDYPNKDSADPGVADSWASRESRQYKLYTRRWLVLGSFALLSMSSSWIWITWSPIAASVAEYWGVSVARVDALAGVYLYLYVPFSFVSNYLIVNHLGLHCGLITGATLNALGAWIRYQWMSNYPVVYLGTFLCALAQTFTLSTPPFIAGSWFGATERATATALGVMANQFGTTLGLGITILVRFTTTMSGGSTGNNNDHMSNDNSSNVNHHVQLLDPIPLHHYLAVQMYISVFALVLVLVWGGDRPPTPPSAAAEGARAADAKKPTATTTAAAAATILTTYPSQHQTNQCDIVVNGTTLTSVDKFDCKETHCSYQSEYIALSGEGTQDIPDSLHKSHHPNYTDISPNYFESICLVFLSSSNVIFVAAFGTAVGVFYTIDTFISQLTPVWWPPEWNGWLGVIFQLTGLLGSFLSGRWMDTTSNQKHVCLCLLLLSAVSLATLVLSLCLLGAITTEDQHENTVQSWIGITGLLVGAFGAGLGLAGWNAAGLELGTGIAYPAEEAAVAGILESSAELFGFLWVTIGSAMLVEHRPLPFVMVLVVAVCASALMVQGLQAKTQRPL